MKSILLSLKEKLKKISLVLGKIQSSILLGIFYFLILGPTSILYRISRLFSKKPENKNSYWIKRKNQPVANEDLEKQF